jgi:hypothetical protein
VFLSRIFSAILDYNYVFLAISLATLGVGLGGYLAYKWSGFIYRFRSEWLGLFALLLIVFVFAMYALPYLGIWSYAAMALVPFLAGGSLLAAIVQRQRDWIHAIYFSDLAGAGIGAGCSVWLMNIFGPMQTISLLSAALWMVSSAFLAGIVKAIEGLLWCNSFLAVDKRDLSFFKHDSVSGLPDESVKRISE